MNPYKKLKYIGGAFVIIAVVVLLVSLGMASKSGNMNHALFGAIFFFVFGVLGAFMAKVGVECTKKEVFLIEKGTKFTGKICEVGFADNGTLYMRPHVLLTVRYFDGDAIMEAKAKTGSTNPAEFPKGATITISVYNGEATVVPKTLSDEHIEGEQELLGA